MKYNVSIYNTKSNVMVSLKWIGTNSANVEMSSSPDALIMCL